MQPMYPGIVNSPQTELASAIDDEQTTIPLLDASVLPPPPNLATLGTGEDAETILYTGVEGHTLTGVVRGFQGTARAWSTGTKVARRFTAYDWDSARQNIEDHETRIEQNTSAVQQVANDLGAHLNDFAQVWSNRIVEMGTNANGTYVRWSNGLQVCYVEKNDGVQSLSAYGALNTVMNGGAPVNFNWVFPAAFASNPEVIANFYRPSLDEQLDGFISVRTVNPGNAHYRYIAVQSGSFTLRCFLLAVGRWK